MNESRNMIPYQETRKNKKLFEFDELHDAVINHHNGIKGLEEMKRKKDGCHID